MERTRRKRSWAAAIVLSLGCVLAAGTATAGVHEGQHGTYYIPDGLASDAIVPVLLVERGLAVKFARLWPSLSARLKLIIVETLPPKAQTMDAAALDKALAEAATHHAALPRCPLVMLGFSAGSVGATKLVMAQPERYQGLVIANAGLEVSQLPRDLSKAKHIKVAILHGKKDPTYPVERAQALQRRFYGAGFEVFVQFPDTNDHMAPVTEAGAPFLAGFLQRAFPGAATAPPTKKPAAGFETVETVTGDGVKLTADLYSTGDKKAPIVLLFHQARSSRGEYRKIAPRLVKAGYSCLALDQRSGDSWEDVENETAKAAKAAGKGQEYRDARPDLDRAVAWARELGFTGKLAIWGSSYSASLAIFLGAELKGIDAVVSFSPGDYLRPRGSILDAAGKLEVPILVVCPPNEEAQARHVFTPIAAEEKELFIQVGGQHGSRTLYRSDTAEEAWERVLAFLKKHL